MIFQVGITDTVNCKACIVFHTRCISLRVCLVERKMEMEVWIFLFKLPEVLKEESLTQGSCTIEEVHFAVGCMQRLCHVHDLCPQRCHTRSTTNPNHLLTGSEIRVEVAIRPTHHHLISRLEREDIRGSDTCRHVLETYLRTWKERRCSNTNGKRNDVALGRIVGHGISTNGRFGVMCFEREDIKLLPCTYIFLANECLIEVFIIVDAVICRDFNLCIRAGNEVHMLSGRQ